jgi:hypothetical protein
VKVAVTMRVRRGANSNPMARPVATINDPKTAITVA